MHLVNLTGSLVPHTMKFLDPIGTIAFGDYELYKHHLDKDFRRVVNPMGHYLCRTCGLYLDYVYTLAFRELDFMDFTYLSKIQISLP